jgi:cobalt-zinc-cadmium efflux system membrane fusion protein
MTSERIAPFAMAIVVTVAIAGCSPKPKEPSQPTVTSSGVMLTDDQRKHVQIYTVAGSDFHKEIDTTGIVDFDNDQATSVLAPISGPVSRILVVPGQHVKKSEPLAVVDSPDFAEAVSTYRKAVTTAQTNRRLADMDKDLLAHQGVARREEEQAQTDAAGAEADREAALQALVALDLDPKIIAEIRKGRVVSHIEGIIRSPIAGTVVERLITPGELLQAGTTAAFTIANLSRVWVMAQVFGSDLSSINVGDPARIQTGINSDAFSGHVDNISALVNPDTRSVQARVVVDNPGDALKKQMYVHVQIQSRRFRQCYVTMRIFPSSMW